jgi:hypothetical protein
MRTQSSLKAITKEKKFHLSLIGSRRGIFTHQMHLREA